MSQVTSKIGAGQTVDEEVDAVVAEEDGARDVYPATASVRLRWVFRQLEHARLTNGCTLQEPDVVGTPSDEEWNVEDNERGGDHWNHSDEDFQVCG